MIRARKKLNEDRAYKYAYNFQTNGIFYANGDIVVAKGSSPRELIANILDQASDVPGDIYPKGPKIYADEFLAELKEPDFQEFLNDPSDDYFEFYNTINVTWDRDDDDELFVSFVKDDSGDKLSEDGHGDGDPDSEDFDDFMDRHYNDSREGRREFLDIVIGEALQLFEKKISKQELAEIGDYIDTLPDSFGDDWNEEKVFNLLLDEFGRGVAETGLICELITNKYNLNFDKAEGRDIYGDDIVDWADENGIDVGYGDSED